MKHQDKIKRIINAFYKVYNTLGYGFLEKVYQNALYYELKSLKTLPGVRNPGRVRPRIRQQK
jgi:GxxExxY protein